MVEKKLVGRNVAIALGIICIAVTISLVGAIADYASIISRKDNIITSKDSQIASLDSQIANQTSQISNLQNQLVSLNNTANDLNRVVNLEKTQYWAGGEPRQYNASSYDEWASIPSYAGYIEVEVESNATSTYVRVVYNSHGVNYDNQIVVGAGSTRTYFPVLPTYDIRIRVGNSNFSDGALIAVTIIYYY